MDIKNLPQQKGTADEIKPIFTADLNSRSDLGLLKQFFGVKAIDNAFGEGGGGHDEIVDNAAIARLMQEMEAQVPPEIRAQNEQMRKWQEEQIAIKRQTREPEELEIVGLQLGLF